jgi:hypothetical protein
MRLCLSLLVALLSFCLTGCAVRKPMPAGYAASAARKSITVVGDPQIKTSFFSMGLTQFNNHRDEITDAGFSLEDYLVARLKAKGYNARKGTEADPGLQLRLYPAITYGSSEKTGTGVFQRRVPMMKWTVFTFCNVRASLIDPVAKLAKIQPVSFGNTGNALDIAIKNTEASRWGEFSAAEKATIRSSMQAAMNKVANTMFAQLGL